VVIQDEAIYAVTLERGTDGSYLAWVDDVPGCAVRGASRQTVLDRLPDAIRTFLEWTGAADLPATIDVRVTDEVESAIEADEDTEVLVAADRQPLTNDDWRRLDDWLRRSRLELVDLLETLSDEQLAKKRPGSERTICEEFEHIAFVEFMYAVWTFDLHSRQGLADFLAWTRGVAAERVRVLADRRAADLTWANWAGAPRPEPWTPRKSARRLVWHELLHLRAIEHFVRGAD